MAATRFTNATESSPTSAQTSCNEKTSSKEERRPVCRKGPTTERKSKLQFAEETNDLRQQYNHGSHALAAPGAP